MASHRFAVLAGAAITSFLTVGLFVAERISLYKPLRMTMFRMTGNGLHSSPFNGLYLLAGIFGGVIAGYLTEGPWQSGGANGAKAGLLAAGLLYAVFVVPNILQAVLTGGSVAIYAILIIPLIFVFPVALVFPLESGVTGAITTWLRNA